MSERVSVFSLDLQTAERESIPRIQSFTLHALQDGRIDAVVTSWEVWGDSERRNRLVTHAEETKDQPWGLARDIYCGQGIQLIEDFDLMQKSSAWTPPVPFNVRKGDELRLTAHISEARDILHFTLQRASENCANGGSLDCRPKKISKVDGT
eukprot:gnl/MRDRNA2_/MRDRNA2_220088_c0_seq1.p1 gnl/MRDRNA2_/MRDRNA2_220088_c0~~gnl/MRDRNA2_/MRDRNA2_220088_c0_seq1.p1  ORF type:complete len:178 (+),score=30.52 gnl/MRDRNA2_/MRDRNA2_220088_c0_seq1:80-535(+)